MQQSGCYSVEALYKDYIDDLKAIQKHYGTTFDTSDIPNERNLQKALRSAFYSIITGVSDTCASQKVYPLVDDLLGKFKEWDAYNKKNMSTFREALI